MRLPTAFIFTTSWLTRRWEEGEPLPPLSTGFQGGAASGPTAFLSARAMAVRNRVGLIGLGGSDVPYTYRGEYIRYEMMLSSSLSGECVWRKA